MKTELTIEEKKAVCSLVTQHMGTMQYAALSDPTLDKHWEFWNGISKKLSNDLGFECFCEPVEEITIGEKNHKMSIQEYVAENWAVSYTHLTLPTIYSV